MEGIEKMVSLSDKGCNYCGLESRPARLVDAEYSSGPAGDRFSHGIGARFRELDHQLAHLLEQQTLIAACRKCRDPARILYHPGRGVEWATINKAIESEVSS